MTNPLSKSNLRNDCCLLQLNLTKISLLNLNPNYHKPGYILNKLGFASRLGNFDNFFIVAVHLVRLQ